MRFSDKIPTKGLVRVYLSMHPLVDLEGIISYFHRHVVFERNNVIVYVAGLMAQLGKKNLNMFKALHKEQAEKAKNVENVDVPNLQEPLVKVHVHGESKRKATVLAKQGVGKDLKRVRATFLGPESTSEAKKPEACLIELPEMTVCYDIEISLAESLISSIDNIEPNLMIKAMLEFNSKALILGCRVGTLLQSEIKEGGWAKVEELQEELKV